MASLNKVLLIGNLTRDPEIRYVPSGSAVATFTLAVNRVYKLQTGEKKEEVSFIRIIVWGRMAEICGEYLTKGRPCFVEGRLQSRTWDGPDGQKRSALEVIASNVQFLNAQGQATGGKGKADFVDQSSAPLKDEMGEIQLDDYPDPASKGASSGSDVPF